MIFVWASYVNVMPLLDVEDSVPRVHSSLVLCGLTNQTLFVGKGDE